MRKINRVTFVCPCSSEKSHRLIFDGGSTGQYVVEFCKRCYQKEDKRFLISEEIVVNKSNIKSEFYDTIV